MRRSVRCGQLAIVAVTLMVLAVSAARANDSAVVMTGSMDAKKQTTAFAAVTSALVQAKWTLVDTNFTAKEVETIRGCFEQEQPWPCIQPLAEPKAISRVVVIDMALEKPGTIRITAQFASSSDATTGFEKGFCPAPCSDSSLAQSATELVNRLLSNVTGRIGKTFVEVVSDPPGAAVTIDGRQVGPAGQKFPARAGQHRVLVQLSGRHDTDTTVEVAEGETKRVELKLEPLDVERHDPRIPEKRPPRRLQYGMIVGGAAVLIGGGIWSYATALDDAPPPGEPRDSQYLYNGTALVVAGVGGAVAVAGLVWLLRTPVTDAKPTVSVTRDSVGVGWSGSF